ncbi:MAG: glycosyltransferase family 1 protein [Prevotella sp.]|nr:glycosyltransferase family 1 protein [Prevotella sp.]
MRILLIGEYSNVHATLAEGLRKLGYEVTVVSDGDSWKNYPRDIDVSRAEGIFGGLRLLIRLKRLMPQLTGYDIVQIINPMFFELRAERLIPFYHFLRKHNKKVFLGAFGMDWYWVKTCTYDMPLRYSDFNFGSEVRTDPEAQKYQIDWLGTIKERLNREIAADCDGIIAGLYEYWVCYRQDFPQKTVFIPFPIKPVPYPSVKRAKGEKVVIFIGINARRSVYKGTDIMLQAAEDIRHRYSHRMKLIKVVSVPFEQYQQKMDDSDVLLDQLYSYTPAMNALLAMSKGMIVVGGGEPENYEILGETELRPIINVEPNYDSVFHELEQLVLHPERIPELKQQSIEYIKKHHDYVKVAMQYVDFWNR